VKCATINRTNAGIRKSPRLVLSRYLVDSGAKAYHNLGRLYERMGDKEKAKENYDKEKEIALDLYYYWVTVSDVLE
jgi:Tetratricopeptide repeat.